MHITDNDIEFIIKATSCVYESKEEPGKDTASTFGELAFKPLLKRYLCFVVQEQKYMTAMKELLTRTCTPVAVTGPICQNTGKTSQQAIVVDLNKVPSCVGYNRLQLERATRRINANVWKIEILKISQQIVDAAAKFMAISFSDAAEFRPIKNRVSDDLWAAFMVMQDVTGVKEPTHIDSNRPQLERANWNINAKALEIEIFKISQQIVDAAAKFMTMPLGYLTVDELESIKTPVSDDLWAAFKVIQDVTGIKEPTQATKCICQYYHEYHLSQKTR